MQTMATAVVAALGLAATAAGQADTVDPDTAFRTLHDDYLKNFKPLWLESEAAWWEANTMGSDAAFARKKAADKALVELHGDRATFDTLKRLRDGGGVKDAVQRRLLEVMYWSFLPAQGDPDLRKRIVDLENDVEQVFNTHRSVVGGEKLSENDVRAILADTRQTATAEAAWKAYMVVGEKAAPMLKELVSLRNTLAKQMGFPDFHALRLAEQEIDRDRFLTLFDELDELTRVPFAQVKAEIDARRAAQFGLPQAQLRPWHFGDLFFQEAPQVASVDFDALYADVDLLELATRYYASFELPCDDVLVRSDLYEKPGKSPHAFCTDLDREGDIRILCNLKTNLYWADTLVHELGHAVYDKYIRRDLPFLLRKASHAITTEGIANMLGAMVKNPDFLAKVRRMEADEAARVAADARKTLRAEKLLFSRWVQVMVRFEHTMYTQPDQDLNKLWWDLKKRYQLLEPPDRMDRPDYAAKVHLLTSPVYYHSYLMGDLFAAQVRDFIARQVLGIDNPQATCFFDQPLAGRFLKEKVFGPGHLYSWEELTRHATGEALSPRAFVEQFVK